jgi:hypothetical protein
VSVHVVQRLEAVDVEHEQRERRLRRPSVAHHLPQWCFERPQIVQAGEVVSYGQLMETTSDAGELGGDRTGRQQSFTYYRPSYWT